MSTRTEIIDLSGDQPGDAISDGEANPVVTAETMQQIATAKRWPRSIAKFRQSLAAQASTDLSVARQCHYAIPRAGKTIEGPSIRFAEMVLQAWGNARAATRLVGETERFVIAQGVFYDFQNNVQVGEEVTRRIIDSDGNRYGVDMIGVTGAAARSVALRNAILRGVPKALWWDGYGAARLTIVGDIKTMKTRRDEALAWFKSHGIADAQVFATLAIGGLADLGPDQLITLAGFRTSIEDEGKDPESIFRPAETRARVAAPPAPNPGGAPADPVPPTQGPNGAPSGPLQSAEASSAGSSPRGAAGEAGDRSPGRVAPGAAGHAPIPESPPVAGPTSPGPDSRPGGSPPAATAPVETPAKFTFADIDAARGWAFEVRQRFEDLGSAAEVKALKETADFKARIDALYDIDNDAAVGVLALAQDLIDTFASEARR